MHREQILNEQTLQSNDLMMQKNMIMNDRHGKQKRFSLFSSLKIDVEKYVILFRALC